MGRNNTWNSSSPGLFIVRKSLGVRRRISTDTKRNKLDLEPVLLDQDPLVLIRLFTFGLSLWGWTWRCVLKGVLSFLELNQGSGPGLTRLRCCSSSLPLGSVPPDNDQEAEPQRTHNSGTGCVWASTSCLSHRDTSLCVGDREQNRDSQTGLCSQVPLTGPDPLAEFPHVCFLQRRPLTSWVLLLLRQLPL